MTAARECQEETGLSAQLITHLGYLEPVLTSTNYLVDQVVGYCAEDPRQLETLLQPRSGGSGYDLVHTPCSFSHY